MKDGPNIVLVESESGPLIPPVDQPAKVFSHSPLYPLLSLLLSCSLAVLFNAIIQRSKIIETDRGVVIVDESNNNNTQEEMDKVVCSIDFFVLLLFSFLT